MTSLPLSGEFPFELLHAEIVDFFYNQEKETKPSEDGDDFAFDKLNAATKLEMIGYRVGYGLVERVAKEVPRISSELDSMKFICKEFWSAVFRKQVDNLRTNHQGVYVVQDNNFWLLTSLSVGEQYLDSAPRYVAFSCGLIRGALANLNIPSLVTCTIESMPAAKFNIHIQQKNA